MASKQPVRFNPIKQLIDLQALAQMQIAKADERMARNDERFAKLEQETKESFTRVEERFSRLEQGLAAIVRMLEQLPDALREKIGFATPRT